MADQLTDEQLLQRLSDDYSDLKEKYFMQGCLMDGLKKRITELTKELNFVRKENTALLDAKGEAPMVYIAEATGKHYVSKQKFDKQKSFTDHFAKLYHQEKNKNLNILW